MVLMRMALLAPFSVSVHGYLAHRIVHGLPLSAGVSALVVAGFAASALLVASTYALVPLTRRPGVGPVQAVGYLAMGYVALMGLIMVARDLAWLALASVESVAFAAPETAFVPLGGLAGVSVLAVLGLTATIGTAAAVRARLPAVVRQVSIPIAGLPADLEGLRIVQVSDLHVGPTVAARRVQEIAEQVAALSPDLLAVTGDLVDAPVSRIGHELAPLLALRPPMGTFFVTGNHEYYVDAPAWCRFLAEQGWTVLQNEHRVLTRGEGRLVVAGVPDPFGHRLSGDPKPDPSVAVAGAVGDATLLLAHRPTGAPAAAAAGVDLQLSGHTHGGQYFPFTWLVDAAQPFPTGLTRVGAMWLFVSRGTAWWGPPMRLGSDHEVTLLVLTAGESG